MWKTFLPLGRLVTAEIQSVERKRFNIRNRWLKSLQVRLGIGKFQHQTFMTFQQIQDCANIFYHSWWLSEEGNISCSTFFVYWSRIWYEIPGNLKSLWPYSFGNSTKISCYFDNMPVNFSCICLSNFSVILCIVPSSFCSRLHFIFPSAHPTFPVRRHAFHPMCFLFFGDDISLMFKIFTPPICRVTKSSLTLIILTFSNIQLIFPFFDALFYLLYF